MVLGPVAEGARMVVVDIAEAAAQALAQDIEAVHGAGRVLALIASVCEWAECQRVVHAAREHFGSVQELINNAGRRMTAIRADYLGQPVRFWEVPVDRRQAVMDLNVRAPFYMAQSLAPHLVEQRWSRIVNITTSLDTMYRASYTPDGPSKPWL